VAATILLAGIQDWIGAIVPIVFLIYALIQLFTAKGAQPPARKPPRRVPPEQAERPLKPQQPPIKAAGTPQAQLNAEIEQFLKRANQRRERSRRESEPSLKAPPKPAPRTIAAPPAGQQPAKAAPAARQQRDLSTVAESVEKHLAGRGFTQRTEHLADDIVRADAQMEEHLKSKFSHKVGRLGDEAAAAEVMPATDAAPSAIPAEASSAMAALMANPQNVRQAFILGEILARPEHRW
jgi:hypothetical protein